MNYPMAPLVTLIEVMDDVLMPFSSCLDHVLQTFFPFFEFAPRPLYAIRLSSPPPENNDVALDGA